VAVLAAAAYLRFSRLGYALMEADQSVILGMALRFVQGGPLPLAGIKSSAGIMMPPLTQYLLALPLFFRQALLPVVAFNALLGFLAVVACWWIVTRLAGGRAGLIAALLFATNPWAVHYSRFFWNQNFVPLFSTLSLGFLLLYFATRPRRGLWLALSFLSLAAVIQLHLAALVLILVVALILLLLRRAVSPRHLALGMGLFVLAWAPYLLYMASTRFADLRAILGALGGQKAHLNAASFLLIRDLVTGHGLVESYGVWYGAVWPGHALTRILGWLFAACVLYAGGYLLLRGRRGLFRVPPEPYGAILAILLLWIVVPGLFYLRHTVYLQHYYFIYLYPAPFMLIGVVADRLLRSLLRLAATRRAPWLRPGYYAAAGLLLGLLLAVGVWQLHLYQVRLTLLGQEAFQQRQVRHMDRLIARMRSVAAAHLGCGLIVISEGHSADASPFGFLADFSASPVRYVEEGRGFIVPSGCATYLDTTGGAWLRAWLGERAVELPGEAVSAGAETWRFFHKPPEPSPYAAAGAQPIGEWVGGLQLWGCELQGELAPGGTAELTLVWRATRPAAEGAGPLHFFNHLVYREDGRLVSQEDGPGVHSPCWQEGDLLVTRFHIPIPHDAPAGAYQVRVGLYGLVDGQRLPLVDGSDALEVGGVVLP
jgi:hypothetical protein